MHENSNLLLEIYIAGNPEPTPYFKWSHLQPEWSRIAQSVQLLRFLYVAKYKLNNIDGSYCGRALQIKLQNSIGVVETSTIVTVLCKSSYVVYIVFNVQKTQQKISNSSLFRKERIFMSKMKFPSYCKGVVKIVF